MSQALKILHALPREGEMRTAALAAATRLPTSAVASAARKLRARGFVARAGLGRYRLTDAGRALRDAGCENLRRTKRGPRRGPPAKPRARSERDKAWWHLRAKGKATLAELLQAAGSAARDSIGTFLTALARAGYLAPIKRNASGPIAWVLKRDSGPLTPVVQRARGHVWDPNQRAYHRMDRP
jgi:DNA-binding MarR family transcriptional regulator